MKLGFLLCLTALFAAAADAETTQRFDIPSQSVATALEAYARQAKVEFMIPYDALKGAISNSVKGEFEKKKALEVLLQGTGLVAQFGADGAVKILRSNASSAHTPGDQMRLAAREEGGAQKNPQASSGHEGAERDLVTVRDSRDGPRPFADGNMDLARSIDDVQPYYIFDAEMIGQSGALDVEDFLRRRLSMDTQVQTNQARAGGTLWADTTSSSFNLRGFGRNSTLVLVNGRRRVEPKGSRDVGQADLNGIPLSAIERIEVLPTSAGGIYGASALGGVINVVLKKKYSGGEIGVTYDNTWDTDASIRGVSGSYGLALEDGRTQLNLSFNKTDATPLTVGERAQLHMRGFETYYHNSGTLPYSTQAPPVAAEVNIASSRFTYALNPLTRRLDSVSSVPTQPVLTLRDGRSLGSIITHLPAGTRTLAQAQAGVLSNAGSFNTDLVPGSVQPNVGMESTLGTATHRQALLFSANRQMTQRLTAFVEYSLNRNYGENYFNPFSTISATLIVPPEVPTNPFQQTVAVAIPNTLRLPQSNCTTTHAVSTGITFQWPSDWVSELDYSYSRSRHNNITSYVDTGVLNVDMFAGAFNPFVDHLAASGALGRYMIPYTQHGGQKMNDAALRAAGPLTFLPWGRGRAAFGLQRYSITSDGTLERYDYAYTASITDWYPRNFGADSAYAEIQLPLLRQDILPLLHTLELQTAGRHERHNTDTGAYYESYRYPGPVHEYGGLVDAGGNPVFGRDSYKQTSHTLGLRWQPVKDLSLRVSVSTAFIPPSADNLTEPVALNAAPVTVTDPVAGGRYAVPVRSGGNAELLPENSRTVDAGVVWAPVGGRLEGLRVNLQYYRTMRYDFSGTLSAQQMVDLEHLFPGRVTRDPVTRQITLLDLRRMNLYLRESSGWDLSLDYDFSFRGGSFAFSLAGTHLDRLRTQYSLNDAMLEYVGYPAEGGAVADKANAGLTWRRGPWSLGWDASFWGSYWQYGAAGGPLSVRSYRGAAAPSVYLRAQGSDTVPSQIVHNMFLGYEVDPAMKNSLFSGVSMRVGVKNVFDELPAYDAYYNGGASQFFYTSPLAGYRLRSYWMNLSKRF